MLERIWKRFLPGRVAAEDIAAEFGRQLPVVKLILYEMFVAAFAKNGVTGAIEGLPSADRSHVYSGQVVNYLTGEFFDPFEPDVPEAARAFAVKI